jgi:flagellar protein FlaI
MKGIKDRIGPKIATYSEAEVYEGFPYFHYKRKEPVLGEKEKLIVSVLKNLITGSLSMDEAKRKLPKLDDAFFREFNGRIISQITYKNALSAIIEPEEFNALKIDLIALFKEFMPEIKDPAMLANIIMDQTVGYSLIAPLIRDPNLEEVMINGYRTPLFVFHKRYGMCKTDILIEKEKMLDTLINRIAATVRKTLDSDNPLLDARLLGGNRANATFSSVTPMGPTLTIRKFSAIPLSVVDLIAKNTLSEELAAFLWVMVEGLNIEPMNMIITGGAGSGKTTLMNALSSFIRYQDRIITIEDTLELHLGSRENWIQMESKGRTHESEEVSMDDLLRNSLRMRPDRLVIGEVRGSEAQTLFVVMDTGHRGCMGTMHSNSGKEMILRLKARPMSVAESMIPLLDLVIVMYRIYHRDKGIIRRVAHVSEVTSMEAKPLMSDIFEWNKREDVIEKTDVPSHTIEVLAEKTMKTKREIMKEISVRKKILSWMLRNNIRSNPEVETVIQSYYINPEELLEEVLGSEKENE